MEGGERTPHSIDGAKLAHLISDCLTHGAGAFGILHGRIERGGDKKFPRLTTA